MTEDQRLLVIGAYINSALYCAGVFVAGILLSHPLAWQLALATVGVTFLSYFAQLAAQYLQPWVLVAFVLITILLGIAAGVVLL
jgi:hypothetical protein